MYLSMFATITPALAFGSAAERTTVNLKFSNSIVVLFQTFNLDE